MNCLQWLRNYNNQLYIFKFWCYLLLVLEIVTGILSLYWSDSTSDDFEHKCSYIYWWFTSATCADITIIFVAMILFGIIVLHHDNNAITDGKKYLMLILIPPIVISYIFSDFNLKVNDTVNQECFNILKSSSHVWTLVMMRYRIRHIHLITVIIAFTRILWVKKISRNNNELREEPRESAIELQNDVNNANGANDTNDANYANNENDTTDAKYMNDMNIVTNYDDNKHNDDDVTVRLLQTNEN
jgi:hypothetical protein